MIRSTKTMLSPCLALVVCLISGCTTPSSVLPLLQAANATLAAETQYLTQDIQRDQQMIEQQKQVLRSAMLRDIEQQTQLSSEWVIQASEAYATAIAALADHQHALQQERDHRAENLQTARMLQERAMVVLQQRDQLLGRLLELGIVPQAVSVTLNPEK